MAPHYRYKQTGSPFRDSRPKLVPPLDVGPNIAYMFSKMIVPTSNLTTRYTVGPRLGVTRPRLRSEHEFDIAIGLLRSADKWVFKEAVEMHRSCATR